MLNVIHLYTLALKLKVIHLLPPSNQPKMQFKHYVLFIKWIALWYMDRLHHIVSFEREREGVWVREKWIVPRKRSDYDLIKWTGHHYSSVKWCTISSCTQSSLWVKWLHLICVWRGNDDFFSKKPFQFTSFLSYYWHLFTSI